MNSTNNKKTVLLILKNLSKIYKDDIALKYNSPIELLIAVILSAQCTDRVVNEVTEKLFKKYKTVKDFANCDIENLKRDIKSTGFFNNKAKNIKETCRIILDEFNGIVPNTMEDLIKLRGVGRKTANIILSTIYNKNEGIAVDTHMLRINYRIGLTTSDSDATKVEKELMEIVPREYWNKYTHLIINHGRAICIARKPSCDICPIENLCEKRDVKIIKK